MYHIGPEVMITSIRNMGVEVAHKQFFSCHCKQASDSMEPPFVVNRYPETKMALRMFLVTVSDRGGRFNGLFFPFECIDFCLQILAHLHDCWCFVVAAA
jgi:hypothetical protein